MLFTTENFKSEELKSIQNFFEEFDSEIKTVSPEEADKAIEILKAQGEDAYVLGSVVDGEEGVILC